LTKYSMYMASFNVRTRVLIGFGTAILLLVAAVVFTMVQMRTIKEAAEFSQAKTERANLAASAQNELIQAVTATRMAALGGKDPNTAAEDARRHREEFERTMDTLGMQVLPEGRPQFNAMAADGGALWSLVDQVFVLAGSDSAGVATEFLLTEVSSRVDRFNASAERYIESRQVQAAEAVDDAANRYEVALIMSLLALATATAAAVSVAAFVSKQVAGEAAETARLHREAVAELQATVKAKEEFVAGVSHEMRTPLSGVIGLLDLVEAAVLSEEVRSNVELAQRSAGDLLVIVGDILDAAELDAGKMALSSSAVDLRSLVADTAKLFSSMAAAQRNEIIVTVGAGVPEKVVADPTRLRQVLTNLVSNALKHTCDGVVKLIVTMADDLRASEGAIVRFEVCDSGTGIGDEMRSRLFVPFSQGNTIGDRRYRGVGLGLSITKRLVEMMGGEVGVDSTLGVGSLFWFTLPAAIAESPAESGRSRTAEFSVGALDDTPGSTTGLTDGARPRALVVDDTSINRLLLSKMLSVLGYDVDEACDGQEAVEAVMGNDYNVVMMDIQMPVLDGVEATRIIRAAPGPKGQTSIIAVTASTMDTQVAKYLSVGMDGVVRKPFRIDELKAVLGKRVSNSSRGTN
jgi:signal transduction histidine kinase/ActR/RegA family two-component response regulator